MGGCPSQCHENRQGLPATLAPVYLQGGRLSLSVEGGADVCLVFWS